LGKSRTESIKAAVVSGNRNLVLCQRFLTEFLKAADGGARLVASWAAILKLSNDEAEVKVYNPNSSDTYAKQQEMSKFSRKERSFQHQNASTARSILTMLSTG